MWDFLMKKLKLMSRFHHPCADMDVVTVSFAVAAPDTMKHPSCRRVGEWDFPDTD